MTTAQPAVPAPLLPAYGGACLTGIVPGLLAPAGARPGWLPGPAADAARTVVFVLDGLGWTQLQDRLHLAPTLASMAGGPITSVVPTTTATALASIALGAAPATHGMVGYRLVVEGPTGPEVMNVLRWRTPSGDARAFVPPLEFQTEDAFAGRPVPVVSKVDFGGSGFSVAHLRGSRLVGWGVASSIAVEVGRLVRAGEPFTYAYYEGVDKIAHLRGLREEYDAELVAADRLVADLLDVLPPEVTLLVTADHGQVEVGEGVELLDDDVVRAATLVSGEARFRWLHAAPGAAADLLAATQERYGHQAWVLGIDQMVEDGWFGGPLPDRYRARLGDVALVPWAPVGYLEAGDGDHRLVCRHGSVTADEMLVPLLAAPGRRRSAPDAGQTGAMASEGPTPSNLVIVQPDGDGGEVEAPATESVEQPAKVMRIGSMIKQLLEEVRQAPLDEASRLRLREIYETSVTELAEGLSPDLRDELGRMTSPFRSDSVPSEGELRVAQAQLVGWLEGLFHGIQATLFAQQMAARGQLEEMRRRSLPPGGDAGPGAGQYL